MQIDGALSTSNGYTSSATVARVNPAAGSGLSGGEGDTSVARATAAAVRPGLKRSEGPGNQTARNPIATNATGEAGRPAVPGNQAGSAKTGDDAQNAGTASDGGGSSRAGPSATASTELGPEDEQALAELKQRDREVRAHEQAHMAAAGSLARGGPQYETARGPDGRMYAIGGEVQIDTSAVPDDPKATIAKAQQVRRAALAPANPSAQDRQVAAKASAMEAEARAELAAERLQGGDSLSSAGATETDAAADAPEATTAADGARDAPATVCEQCGGKHSGGAHSAFNQREMDRMIVAAQPGSAPTLELRA